MGIDPGHVTACLVTRGNVDLTPILDSLIFGKVIVWDNSQRQNMLTYGRYCAAAEAPTDVVFFQDDDVIVPRRTQHAMCRHYVDGLLNANIEQARHGEHWAWVGWGALVQRELPELAFQAWRDAGQNTTSRSFRLVGCDIVSGYLTPHRKTSFAYRQLPYAYGRDRAYLSEGFGTFKVETHAAVQRITPMLKLNLGCGAHRLDGFVNLDKDTGWTFESGLPYEDESVDAVTVSHALMYVALRDWPVVFSEITRVLKPGGVVRVTEDSTADPKSERFGGHPDARTLTDAPIIVDYMELAGLEARGVRADETSFRDDSLIQNWHGGEPKVFHVEGAKA